MLQEIGTAAVLAVVDLHSGGVLGHAAAARLARAGWRVEDAAVADDGPLGVGALAAYGGACPTPGPGLDRQSYPHALIPVLGAHMHALSGGGS